MMMAQPFPAHQGIPQHPGLPPGHPMAQAQHPNATHLGGQAPAAGMVQQMHPGVSAPAGPQVSQAGPMMGGMPPGAGTTGPGGPMPNAHALSHLGPAQAHLFQQQQFAQNFANNPQLLQQHQQQYLRHRQQLILQQQQQQQHQQQHGGLPVSLPTGTQGLNAAQLAAMQANPNMRPVGMQMHLQQQMPHGQPQNLQQQQLFAMQQAQQAQQVQQAQQAQQVHQANNAGQQTPQQRAAAQPQNMHEAQNTTPQPQQGPPPQGSNTPSQQQSNPQQQPPTSQPQQQQGPQPQQQQTPNPQQQQQQQAQQAQQSQQQPQQQQAQQQQHQQQQQQQQQQHQQQQHHPQHPHPQMTVQEAQLKAQQQSHNAMLMQQRMNFKGSTILCLNAYADYLSNFTSRGESLDLQYWHAFVDRFYSQAGVLRQGVWNPQTGSKQFEISTPALARYYWTQFNSGIKHIQMIVEGARERDLPNGGHLVESPKTSFIYWFTNDCQLFTNGTLRAQFDANNKIEILDLVVNNHNEYIPRGYFQPPESSDQKQSPKVAKGLNKRAQQKQPQQSPPALPESMVTANGVPTAVMTFLEVAETISQMQTLFQFSQQNPQYTPPEALRHLVNQFQSQNAGLGFAQGQMNPALQQGQAQRTPNLNGPSQFASPSVAHLGLPAQSSPHIPGSAHPSPAQTHLAGPTGMVAPQNQPGANAAGNQTSTNTSPNVSNKRRRASTVKIEGDDGGGATEVNGTGAPGAAKVKASPRVGGKRQKGTA